MLEGHQGQERGWVGSLPVQKQEERKESVKGQSFQQMMLQQLYIYSQKKKKDDLQTIPCTRY